MSARRILAIALMASGLVTAGLGTYGVVFRGSETPTVTAKPTSSPSPSPTQSVEQKVTEFYVQFQEAFRTGDETFLFDHLHPEVLKLYGETQCRDYLSTIKEERTFEVLQIHQPAAWNFGERESREIPISDAIQVDAIQRLGSQEGRIAAHVAVTETLVQWFTDCGDPV